MCPVNDMPPRRCRASEPAGAKIAAEKARRQAIEDRAGDLAARLADADAAQAAAAARQADIQAALADERSKTASLERAVHSLRVVRAAERQEALKR